MSPGTLQLDLLNILLSEADDEGSCPMNGGKSESVDGLLYKTKGHKFVTIRSRNVMLYLDLMFYFMKMQK